MRVAFLASIVLTGLGFAACSSFSADETAGSSDAGAAEGGGGVADAAAPDGGDGGGDAGEAGVDRYRAAVLASGPIAYWRMGIASGLTIKDETSGGNPLTLQGAGVALGVEGAVAGDTAIRFDGVTGYAIAENARAFDFVSPAQFTIECWAKYEELDAGKSFPTLMASVEGNNATENGYELYIVRAAKTVQFNHGVDPAVATALPAGDGFHHYAATHDGVSTALYVDGKLSAPRPAPSAITKRASSFSVGARSGGAEWFPGVIDEVAVYDRALTVSEIASHIAAR